MKQLIKRLTGLCILIFLWSISFSQVKKVAVIGLTVKDMNRSMKFYHDVLGFKKISDREFIGADYEDLEGIFGLHIRVVNMQLGDETIELTDYLTTGGRSIPSDMHSNDLSFQHIAVAVSNMENAYAQLRKYGVEYVSTAPQTLPLSNKAAAGIKAFYFHDPDNHVIELIYFPKGKGLAKWQAAKGKIFLGIDHTAIGIANTERSLHFYHDLLGIEPKGESWNKGTEQEHLNNVSGASLHITGLRNGSGPGIEFLQYLQPGIGKPYPTDTRADDIWYWQTTLIVPNVQNLYEKLKLEGYQFISSRIVNLVDHAGKSINAFIVKDPDGHAMIIRQEY